MPGRCLAAIGARGHRFGWFAGMLAIVAVLGGVPFAVAADGEAPSTNDHTVAITNSTNATIIAAHDAVSVAMQDALNVAVRDAVRNALDAAVRNALDAAVHDAINIAVRDALNVTVHDAVNAALRNNSELQRLQLSVNVINATVSTVNATVNALSTTVSALNVSVSVLQAAMVELEESTVTPTIAARIESCEEDTVVFSATFKVGTRDFYQECSAIPMPLDIQNASAVVSVRQNMSLPPLRSAHASEYFLSAAHCFVNRTDPTHPVLADTMAISFKNITYTCHLAGHFLDESVPVDLATVVCNKVVPVPQPVLSPYLLANQLSVALVGFAAGRHKSKTATIHFGAHSHSSVLHHKFTRIALGLQFGQQAVSASDPSLLVTTEQSLLDEQFPLHPSSMQAVSSAQHEGYVERSPVGGMSGGAVLDMKCRVLGITEARSVFGQGGQFVSLGPAVKTLLIDSIIAWERAVAHKSQAASSPVASVTLTPNPSSTPVPMVCSGCVTILPRSPTVPLTQSYPSPIHTLPPPLIIKNPGSPRPSSAP